MRLIDADALIKALCADNDGIGRADAKAVMTCLEDVFLIIDTAPSIDVVRCKECRCYIDFIGEQFINAPTLCGRLSTLDNYVVVKPNDFCSYGEREGE